VSRLHDGVAELLGNRTFSVSAGGPDSRLSDRIGQESAERLVRAGSRAGCRASYARGGIETVDGGPSRGLTGLTSRR